MAQVSEFLQALTEQLKSLQKWFNELDQSIPRATSALSDLRRRRQDLMSEQVTRALPDLSERTLERAQRYYPGVIDPEKIPQLLDRERAVITRQLDSLPDEKAYGFTATETATRELAREQKAFDGFESAYKALLDIAGLQDLVTRRYGTPEYTCRWYHLQYYYDWKRADEITETLSLGRWDVVRDQFEASRDVFLAGKKNVQQLSDSLATIKDHQRRSAELTQALNGVPDTVLEMLRVNLRAALESPTAQRSQEVDRIDEQISKLEAELSELRSQREKVAEKMTRLQELSAKTTRSRVREVPDTYVEHVRRENATNPRVVYVERHDDWMTNYLLYNAMFDSFDHRSSDHHRGHTESSHVPTQSNYTDTSRYGSVS